MITVVSHRFLNLSQPKKKMRKELDKSSKWIWKLDYGKCLCLSFPHHDLDLIEELDIQADLECLLQGLTTSELYS